MPANMKRMLPILLVMVVVLFIVPQLTKKKSSAGPNSSARATQTIDAMTLIEKGEQTFMTANGAFTAHLADLIQPGTKLAEYLATGVTVSIDAGTGGKQYVATVESDVLRLVRARGNGKMIAQSCLVLKSGGGVACPVLPA